MRSYTVKIQFSFVSASRGPIRYRQIGYRPKTRPLCPHNPYKVLVLSLPHKNKNLNNNWCAITTTGARYLVQYTSTQSFSFFKNPLIIKSISSDQVNQKRNAAREVTMRLVKLTSPLPPGEILDQTGSPCGEILDQTGSHAILTAPHPG